MNYGGILVQGSTEHQVLVSVVRLSTGEPEEGEWILRLPDGTVQAVTELPIGGEGDCMCCGNSGTTRVEVELPSSSWHRATELRVFIEWQDCFLCCSLTLTTPVEEGDQYEYYTYMVAHEIAEQDGWRWNKHRQVTA